jgi:hypothetical protein
MRRLPFLIIALAVAVPAESQPAGKLGARTVAPEQLLDEANDGDADAELERAIAAAAAYPLGSLSNPVRVGGPEGARAYLARLRCADGAAPRVGPSRPGGVGAYGTIVDLYPLDCGAAAPGRAELIVDLYHEEHREQRAPPGFSIGPR